MFLKSMRIRTFVTFVAIPSYYNKSANNWMQPSLFKIFPERTFAAILKTLNIFTNWNISNVDKLCCIQILLILSQIFVFITIISILLSNLHGLNYKNKSKPKPK